MPQTEPAGPDFDILLFDDEELQYITPKSEPTSPKPCVKHEDDEVSGVENEGVMLDVCARQHAMDCIEEWMLDSLIEMSSDKPLCKKTFALAEKGIQYNENNGTFPAQANKVAEIAHQALRDNIPITKRDIYYADVPLFGKQSVVDTLVDDLAATWGLHRSNLNIRAALKGLFVGSVLTLHLSHGELVRGLDHEATLIPVGEDITEVGVDEKCQWILVVEKDAVFQTLIQLGFHTKHGDIGFGIIITGKGYPDLATRQLVSTLSEQVPATIPVMALVDGDPHGLEILTTYKLGSKSMAHENDHLVAPRIEWIGVQMEDIERLGIDSSRMIPLTPRDRHKANKMLDDPELVEEVAAQLEWMLVTGLKAEIEVVSAIRASGPHTLGGSRALDQYLHDKIVEVQRRVGNIKLEHLDSQESPAHIKEEPSDAEYLDFDDSF